jgi:hypothetical protein
MDNEARAELLRLLALIAPRLFDDDPLPAAGRLKPLAEKYKLHPTQFSFAVAGLNQLEETARERDEAILASWRDWRIFEAACQAKGYVGLARIAEGIKVSVGMVREWREIGRVPAIFFSILAAAPAKRDREKEIRGMMAEAKRRVRAEDRKREAAARAKARQAKAAAPPIPDSNLAA